MKKEGQGQAALEYLSSYGWAIIVVLAAIGALAYFGVLNPGQYFPSSFTMSDGLSAGEYKIDEGSLRFTVKNNFGVDIDVLGYNVTPVGGAVDCGGSIATTYASPVDVDSEDTYQVIVPACRGLVGQRFKADITIVYQKAGETVNHTVDGEVQATIEEGAEPFFGDGTVDPGEECDDGVNDGSYGTCNPDGTLAPYCGDGVCQILYNEKCNTCAPDCRCERGSCNFRTGQCEVVVDPGTCNPPCRFGYSCVLGRCARSGGGMQLP